MGDALIAAIEAIGLFGMIVYMFGFRPSSTAKRVPRGWTVVTLVGPFLYSEFEQKRDWLDEHCKVKPGNAAAPFKKSDEWMMMGSNVYAIKDPDVAFHFKMRWR